MEFQLKPKIVLKPKQTEPITPSFKRMKINLLWNSKIDLDLMLFYKDKTGREGACISELLGDVGSATEYPYIEHKGEDLGGGADNGEEIQVHSLATMDKVYIVVLNYEDAFNQINSTFSQYGGQVSIITDSGDNLEVPLDAQEQGHAVLICTIDNSSGNPQLINENKVITISQLIRDIPGTKILLG